MNCCGAGRPDIWDPLEFASDSDFGTSGPLTPTSARRVLEKRAEAQPRLCSSDPRHNASSSSRCPRVSVGVARILEELKVLQAGQVRVEGFLSKWIERQNSLGLQIAEHQAHLDCGLLGLTKRDLQEKMDEASPQHQQVQRHKDSDVPPNRADLLRPADNRKSESLEERQARNRGRRHSAESNGSVASADVECFQMLSREPKVEEKEKVDSGLDKRMSCASTAGKMTEEKILAESPRQNEKAMDFEPAVGCDKQNEKEFDQEVARLVEVRQDLRPSWLNGAQRKSMSAVSGTRAGSESWERGSTVRKHGRPQYLKQQTMKKAMKNISKSLLRSKDSGQRVPVLNPTGYFIQCWQPTFLLALSFALVSAPFDMAFFWWTPNVAYKVVGKFVDVFFIADVFLHFNVAIIHHGLVVTSRKQIALHYAKTTLFLDIVSNIPYDWFFGSEGKGRKLIKLVKLPKLLRFMRLVKLLQEAKAVGVAPTVAGICLLAHYFSCLWSIIFLGECDEKGGCPPVGSAYLEGVSISLSGFAGSDSWTRLLQHPDSSHLLANAEPGQGLRAVDELVALMMTLTGFLLLAALFGNVASSLQCKNAAAANHKMLLDTRKMEMEAAQIPKGLQAKVEKTYEYLQRFGGSRDGMIRDETLSLDLRRSLALTIYGESLRKVPLFQNIEDVYLRSLAQRIEMRLYTPGDFLIMKGEVGYELFMVYSGSVQVVDEDKRVLMDDLCEGSYFGEVCFLQPGSRRSASVLCKEFCRTMVLTLSVFHELNLDSVLDEIRGETTKKAFVSESEEPPGEENASNSNE